MAEHKLPDRQKGRPGISPETRQKIVNDLRDASLTQQDIAKRQGVSTATVSKVYTEEKEKEKK